MLKRIVLLLLLLIFSLAALSYFLIRSSFPDKDGDIKVSGLKQEVSVYTDPYGVPHVYARTSEDLFFAQGYLHAQDRFWQMDYWRHIGAGRLSEMFGSPVLKTDQFLRTLGWAAISEQEYAQLDGYSKALLDSYSAGVNAYLKDFSGKDLSVEYLIMNLTNKGYKPEPWKPAHSLMWGKVMAWDLGMNMYDEIARSRLLNHFSQDQVETLFPSYPQENPFILPSQFSALPEPQVAELFVDHHDLFSKAQKNISSFRIPQAAESGIGSNNWVISGRYTATGKPLLANDPHLSAQMPSIWYQIGLHCETRSPSCAYDVAGFSFAGVPGVILGHNNRIGWGFTNVGPDVMDIVIEKLDPENPNRYEWKGQYLEMDLSEQTIHVAGSDPVKLKIRKTKHGPIISDVYGAVSELTKSPSAAFPPKHALALRWTALEPTVTFPAIWKMNLAQNWQEFRTAASEFDVPSQNMVYADVDGNIGYQVPGKIPLRSPGDDGRYPVAGWTGENEWLRYIPFEELPTAFNPAQGYVASANNPVIGSEYPYMIASDWDYGYRAKRIVEMIEKEKPLTVETIKKMQGDNKNINAEMLVPLLMKLQMSGNAEKYKAILKNWDFQQHMDQAAPALFETFWRSLLSKTFDELGEDSMPGGGNRWITVVKNLVQEPESLWWDNSKTGAKERRDDILKAAFEEAVTQLQKQFGEDASKWRWGQLHTTTFVNESFGQSGYKPIEWLLNRGPFATSGGSAIVNATAWDASESFEVTALPSMRMILDISDWNKSLTVHTTGQSGHAFHKHYIDMADNWRKLEYYPMHFSKTDIQSAAASTLKLQP